MDSDKEKKNNSLSKALSEMGELQEQSKSQYTANADAWWNNLSYDDKLKAFYSVCSRIHKGDFIEGKSYRGVLYDIFDFGLDSYSIGMMCGYLEIHNSIVPERNQKMQDIASQFIANFPTEEIPPSVFGLWQQWIVHGGVPNGWSEEQAYYMFKEFEKNGNEEK